MFQDELCDDTVGGMDDGELLQSELVTSQQSELVTAQPELVTPTTSAKPTATASTPSTGYSKSTNRKRRQSELDDNYNKSMESPQQLINSRIEKQKAAVLDDEDDIFGKMVACECRKIKDPKNKRTVKKKINDLLQR